MFQPTLPEQTVLPRKFAFQKYLEQQKMATQNQSEETKPESASKRSLDIIEGGQVGDKEGILATPVAKAPRYDIGVKESRDDYLTRAQELSLSDENLESFFYQEGLTFSFGSQTEHRVRLGYDNLNNVWKVYVKRRNTDTKPSILGFLLTEMDDIMKHVGKLNQKIDEGLEIKVPYLKPASMAGWTLEQPMNNLNFWLHEDCYYSPSGHSRLRLIWQPGNIYMFHFNIVKIPGTKYPNHHGPKIRLSRKEVKDLVEIYGEILDAIGPASLVKAKHTLE